MFSSTGGYPEERAVRGNVGFGQAGMGQMRHSLTLLLYEVVKSIAETGHSLICHD